MMCRSCRRVPGAVQTWAAIVAKATTVDVTTAVVAMSMRATP